MCCYLIDVILIFSCQWHSIHVALKKLKNVNDAQFQEFSKEVAVLQKLRHPGMNAASQRTGQHTSCHVMSCRVTGWLLETAIVQFLGVWIAPDTSQYIVMEFIQHGSLLSLLRKRGDNISLKSLVNMYVLSGTGESCCPARIRYVMSCHVLLIAPLTKGETNCLWHGLLGKQANYS
jgi:serine/threonine protein kinase